MSDVIIRAENLSKVYRLYSKPQYRMLDMFGLLRTGQGRYTEHIAVDHLNLEIRRGEKVAFIGRNGAGKSTLLKLIARAIEPTSGRLEVRSRVHALLQIGTGFHPEFTGRENVYSYLSQLGVAGGKADRMVDEIVEFAELEEYIDQPIKTYSTGMVARLMFAASTVIEPELLVLDEILGVGDAYFSQKSFERIREMCEAHSTTVLLVSHDIYSAAKLCDRMIWIDQGQLVFDGTARDAILSYETSIREQEEKRLRAKKLLAAKPVCPVADCGNVMSNVGRIAIVEFKPVELLAQPVCFQKISVLVSGGGEISIPIVESSAFNAGDSAQLILEESNWGEVKIEADQVAYREMKAFGSPYNKVAFLIRLPHTCDLNSQPPQIRCSYLSASGAVLRVTWFSTNRNPQFVGELPSTNGDWVLDQVVKLERYKAGSTVAAHTIGTNRIRVLDARFIDQAGAEIFFIRHGEPALLLIQYQINDTALHECPQIVVAFHRDGSFDTCRYICRNLMMDGTHDPAGTIEFLIERMPLADGHYTATVLIAREGYYDEEQAQYFTINPGVYACYSRILEFEVIGGRGFAAGTVFVGEAQWALRLRFPRT